jgi:hypothetical protein
MKNLKTVVVAIALALPAGAGAMEFQTPGAVGIGGAGVARNTDAYATYWNPAGLAFYEKPFSSRLNAGVGISINSSLADDVDKLGKMNINDLKNLSFSNASLNTSANLSASAQAVEFVGIVNDLDRNKGTLVATPGGMLAFQYRNFGVGAIATSELGAFPVTDITNVRLGDPSIATLSNFATGIGATPGTSPGTLLSATQRQQVQTAFFNNNNNGISAAQATAIVNKLEVQLQNGNKSGQTAQQLADAMIRVANSFSNSNGSIENNNSTIEIRGILLTEIPIAYGHKFDLGSFGKIGLGAAFKVIQGTVFSSSQKIVKINGSSDILKKLNDQTTDSINVGVDLGAQWRYEELKFMGPINVGFVVKNVNSPEFDAFQAIGAATSKVKVEPQARLGVALDPFSWLSLAADMDVTKNKTVLNGVESQNIGGGLEVHASWIAARAGAYKNIAESSNKPVLTAGLSLGPKWLRLDIDAAVSTEKARYENTSYPREAKVELGMSTAF